MSTAESISRTFPLFSTTNRGNPPANEEVFARLQLMLLPRVGVYTAQTWIGRFGSGSEALRQIRAGGLWLPAWDSINFAMTLERSRKQAEEIIHYCFSQSIQIILSESALFPEALKKLSCAPLLIFAKGNVQLLRDVQPKICFMGKRKSTAFGLRAISSIVEYLSAHEYGIISALGTDSGLQAAYTAARNNRSPILISPVSLDKLMRSSLRTVAHHLLDCGGVILSDQIPGMRPSPAYNALTQVRLQVAPADGLVLTESDPQAGTSFAVVVSRQLELPVFATHPTDTYALQNQDLLRLLRNDSSIIQILSRDETDKIVSFFGHAERNWKTKRRESKVVSIMPFHTL